MRHINLRIPDDLHDKLKVAADEEMRSINSLLLVLIDRAVGRNRPEASPRPGDSQPDQRDG